MYRFGAVLLCAAAFGETYFPVPAEAHPERFGHGIQRTMTLLATSTPAHRNPVRILFYGQSITKQEWSEAVTRDLRARFPHADLTVQNRAIGGYSSEYLIRTLPHDVYDFYPDLVIFHLFGGQENFAGIIDQIRRNTTAEILMQSYYPLWFPVDGDAVDKAQVKREAASDAYSFQFMPKLCAMYACEVVDVRRTWSAYLKNNRLRASALLKDGVHLNDHGNYVMSEITKRHLRYEPKLPKVPDPVRKVAVADSDWKDGVLRVEFTGNRVELVAAKGGPFHAAVAEIRIDGKTPSSMPELYYITRPTDNYSVDWPAVNRVTASKPLAIEDWTLRLLETNADDSQWKYEVTGSKTGRDGVGVSTQRFESKSGRVVIEPRDFAANRAFRLRNQLTPVGFEVTWKVIPLFNDRYVSPRVTDPATDIVTLAASGLKPGKHVLELRATGKTHPPLREIRVYRPVAPGAN